MSAKVAADGGSATRSSDRSGLFVSWHGLVSFSSCSENSHHAEQRAEQERRGPRGLQFVSRKDNLSLCHRPTNRDQSKEEIHRHGAEETAHTHSQTAEREFPVSAAYIIHPSIPPSLHPSIHLVRIICSGLA